MEHLIHKYEAKMIRAGLVAPGDVVIGAQDDELLWNRQAAACGELARVFELISINSLIHAMPREPYRTIIEYLMAAHPEAIRPRDTETRTFLHELPVSNEFTAESIARNLSRRKCVLIAGKGLVTYGTVSPEQAFVVFSSVCFACYVKFFSDYLPAIRAKAAPEPLQRAYVQACRFLDEPLPAQAPRLAHGPFEQEDAVLAAMDAAGKATVELKLVDSYFGNVSYRQDGILYISQTTSSMDELPGYIDPCSLEGTTCTAITASSEYKAHREISNRLGCRTILHGHPRFAVIMSLDCGEEQCVHSHECYKACPKTRYINDIPIVCGEVGTGPFGLCNTVPPALERAPGAIVYGHGVFTVGFSDFNETFAELLRIERTCREAFFSTISDV
ncbi:MAG: rRNA adenine dimethylase [Chitinivibrionales bacterium]|nr:rRNA adenine dimethylase [Chitinivibrionales bacterium]